ncbi:MAG: sugar ABC transporter substrate-binding protein [Spirochaetaceae bacterium]|jgi:ABC-type glycerol-3-phosphate transport system substrate-binding protein|nr:sugar ABC transporter substrate-binding protein [Spirochaetaceae bacterium]
MTSRKGVLISILAMALAASSLGSCSKTDAAKVGGKKAGSLTIWSAMSQPERVKSFQDIADAYMKENPDVKITIEVMPWAGTLDKLVAAHLAGNPPDICVMGSGWAQTLAATGALVETTPLINECGGEEAFLKMSLDMGAYENGYYGIPLYVAPVFVVYRKSYLEEAGITTLPATWEEFYAMCVQLTDKDSNRYGFGQVMGGPQSGIAIWTFLQSNDVNMVNIDQNGTWYVDVDAEARTRLVETYNYLYRLLRDTAPDGVISYSQEQVRELIANGTILSRLDTPEIFYDFKTKGNMSAFNDVGYFPFPAKKRAGSGTGGTNLGITAKGNTTLASDYIKWIYEGDRMVDFYISYPYAMFPVKNEMYKSADYRAKLPEELKPLLPDMALEILNHAAFLMSANGPFPYAGEVETRLLLAKPIAEMVTRKITAEQAVDNLLKDLESLIR